LRALEDVARSEAKEQTNKGEVQVTKPDLVLSLAATMLLAMTFAWEAEAWPVTADLHTATKHRSLIQDAGCQLDGRYCRLRYHWVWGLPQNPERRRDAIACLVSLNQRFSAGSEHEHDGSNDSERE
jgi:hypothetical protein